MNLRFATESVVENSADVIPSADALLRAIRVCTRINNRGEQHEPPSQVIVLRAVALTRITAASSCSLRWSPRLPNPSPFPPRLNF